MYFLPSRRKNPRLGLAARLLGWADRRSAPIVLGCAFFIAGAEGCAAYKVGPHSVQRMPKASPARAIQPHAPGVMEARAEEVDDKERDVDSEGARSPWKPPVQATVPGIAGAGQLLAAGQNLEALSRASESLKSKASDAAWFRSRAICARAHRRIGDPGPAVLLLEELVGSSRLKRHLPPELIGYELARARMEWAATLDPREADKQWAAAARELTVLLRVRPNRLRNPMRIDRASALAAIGRKADPKPRIRAALRAERALQKVVVDYPNHPEIGRLRLELARALIRGGKVSTAADQLRRIAIERAGEPEARLAWEELGDLKIHGETLGRRKLKAAEKLEQAGFARTLRRVETSRAILDGLVKDPATSATIRRKALRSRAWTAYKQRDFSTCSADLEGLYARQPSKDLRESLSRCLDRGRNYQRAVALWEDYGDQKKSGAAAHARWRALELNMRGGRYEVAREQLDRFEENFRSHPGRRRWLRAWLAYRLDDVNAAILGFAEVEKHGDDRKNAAIYYRGKLLLESGEVVGQSLGRELLEVLVTSGDQQMLATGVVGGAPIYYGLLARQRLLDHGVQVAEAPAPAVLADESRYLGYAEVSGLFERMASDYGQASIGLVRAQQLHAVGWLEEVSHELRVAADEFINSRSKMLGERISSPRTEAHIAGLGWRAEWGGAQVFLNREGRRTLRDPESARAMQEGLRRLSSALDEPYRAAKLTPRADLPYKTRWHRRAFREAIEREAGVRGLAPSHLWALMYTESRFRRHIVSYVGARGALQIMPWTARQLQERLGEFDGRLGADVLYAIDSNAHLAAYYVSELVHKFHGQHPMAYASYNGGPSNVARWLSAKAPGGKRPFGLDDFVEEIPFRETYRYTRRVMEVQAAYALMYEGSLPRWDNAVDPRSEDNIDF